jgi:SAM-dependent methyltransferase
MDLFKVRVAARELAHRLRWLRAREERRRDAAFRKAGAPDGLPMPPTKLIYLVNGIFHSAEGFYEIGTTGARWIRDVLRKNGLELEAMSSILDMGCGCGRVLRHWSRVDGPRFYGCDYNRSAIEWCRGALPFATFAVNNLAPPLPYADASFDLIYVISVFTHLPEHLQLPWMAELRRVLKPGGKLLVTYHGASRFRERTDLSDAARAKFDRGELFVLASYYPGTNVCAAYHPEEYVRGVWSAGYRILDIAPLAATEARQDVALLEKV